MIKNLLFGQDAHHNLLAEIGLFTLRVFMGLTMAFTHGFQKIPPPQQLIDGVNALGFPSPVLFSWAAALAEFGGLFIAIGLFTRPFSFLLAFTMAVAAFVVHAADPFSVKEMALLYFFISMFFMLHGPGRWSVDARLR
ncbi:MAG: DoxX family protein [Oligoflexia bacterium]|nr:DoxX family protein [Oligoflexia bacterium]